MELVTVSKKVDCYDWLHPNEEGLKYKFHGVPKDVVKFSYFIVDSKNDKLDLCVDLNENYSALEFTKDLIKAIKNEYFFFDASSLQLVVDYLEENKEEQEKLMYVKLFEDALAEKNNLIYRIEYLKDRINYFWGIVREFK